jgi:hypothetical protein
VTPPPHSLVTAPDASTPPADRTSRLRRLPWGTLLVEAVFTVVAILLALAADDWRQRREERRLADAALASFAMELRDNQRRLAAVRPYHDSLAVGLRAAVETLDRGDSFTMGSLQPRFRGIVPPMLLSTAWDAALTTGALRHVDYALVSELAALYAEQEELDVINQTMFEALVSPDVIGRGDYATAVRLGAVFFSDVTPLEQRLTRAYAELLRRLPPVDGARAGDSLALRP